jgi:monooxygenase
MSLRLQLNQLGDVVFAVDGQKVDFSEKIMYKGTLFSDVPNLAVSFGYVNASW